MPQCLGIGCAGEVSDVAAPQWLAELLMSWFRGQKGPFPLGASPSEFVCAAARRPGRPGGAAVPSGTRVGAAGRAHPSAEQDKGEGKEDMGAVDQWGRLVSERKKKKEGAGCWDVQKRRPGGLAGPVG
jgi:hypothetical protein